MTGVEALATLRSLAVPVFRTSDAAAALDVSIDAANKTLRRLAAAGLVTAIRHGTWTLDPRPDPATLPEHLTAPLPSYVSLQSALFLHGCIEQIPAVVYAVTLARSGRMRTRLGTFSFHHVEPRFFGGFETTPGGVRLASPEKALVDLLYLSGSKTRLFAALPEIDLTQFHPKAARKWVRRIPSARLRTMTERRLAALIPQSA